jgi:hypothetical protein
MTSTGWDEGVISHSYQIERKLTWEGGKSFLAKLQFFKKISFIRKN